MNSSLGRRQSSRMLSLVVCILVSVTFSQGGYIRGPLGVPHPIIHNRDILQAQLQPRPIQYAIHDGTRKELSYSISHKDYQYLKRHKIEGQDSPYNPDPAEFTPTIVDQNGKHKRDHSQHNVPCPDAADLKRSVGINSISGYNNILADTPLEPVVHKHVYFHVPPPDFELTEPCVVLPPKKNLNIVFIKVPSYEPSAAYLQQLLRAQAPIEDKTLIYVLSKKEISSPPVVLPPKPTAPEVYFVKYKTPNGIEHTNNELSLPSLLQNVSPVLERKRADP